MLDDEKQELLGAEWMADLTDSEGRSPIRVIHGHVQPDTEVMLVQLGVEVGAYEGAMGGVHALPLTQHTCTQAACQLHLILNAAILQSPKPSDCASSLQCFNKHDIVLNTL